MRDLHDLTREEGIAVVAERARTTVRALVDQRRGESAITVDELYALRAAYPDFDLEGTVAALGRGRVVRRRARWQLRGRRE